MYTHVRDLFISQLYKKLLSLVGHSEEEQIILKMKLGSNYNDYLAPGTHKSVTTRDDSSKFRGVI